jgi:branched-chain amino acid transport system permease protein
MAAVQHVLDAITLAGLYSIFALGIALVYGTMRMINFAYGEFIMVGVYAVVLLNRHIALPVVAAAAIAVCVVLAVATERVAFRPVRAGTPATLMVTSFAVSYILQNLAVMLFGALPRTADVAAPLSRSVDIGPVSFPRLNLVTIAATAVLLAALAGFLYRTTMGTQMRASAEDFRMARLLGVRSNRVIATAFALSGVLAGVGGLLLIAQSGTASPTLGTTPLIVAFFATVLGGLGSLTGSLIGAATIAALTVAFQVGLPGQLRSFRDGFVYAVVVVLLLVRPQGLIVPASARRRV